MTKRTETGTAVAWFPGSWIGPEDLKDANPEVVVTRLAYSNNDMAKNGWSRAGTAQITVTLDTELELVENKVVALRSQRQQILADSQLAVTEIDEKIQSLLAISYDGAAT